MARSFEIDMLALHWDLNAELKATHSAGNMAFRYTVIY